MGLLPSVPDYLQKSPDIKTFPNKTYRLDPESKRIIGTVDGIEAIKQAFYLHLSTEQYDYSIFPMNDYGIHVSDLYGVEPEIVMTILKQRIGDACSIDTRFKTLTNYNAFYEDDKVIAEFTIVLNDGVEFDMDLALDLFSDI